jgi:hypothetical protein
MFGLRLIEIGWWIKVGINMLLTLEVMCANMVLS